MKYLNIIILILALTGGAQLAYGATRKNISDNLPVETQMQAGMTYSGNVKTKKFHNSGCKFL